MKKTFFVLILTVILLGLNRVSGQFIIPANAYTLTSTAGTFSDIAGNNATVKLGDDLPAGTALVNGFFINDDQNPFVTHAADKTKTDPGFELGFTFNFCGKPMTHFTICASGGIHFGADGNIPQAQSSAWFTLAQDFQNLVTLT
ncbi:MAG: hypothetical protein K2O01_02310, partial [Bacteroidales bacterium]|nr:hypothetical protein [Bacteroidales bacterium]